MLQNLFHYAGQTRRLKSRRSFLHANTALTRSPSRERIHRWMEQCVGVCGEIRPSVDETLPPGGECSYGVWRALNRLRSGVGRCGVDMVRWVYGGTDKCRCGTVQTRDHFLRSSDVVSV